MRDVYVLIEGLREFAIKHTKMNVNSIHGVSHWDRVAKNADSLKTCDVDVLVVKAFAYVHEVERENENDDPQHGLRAAKQVDEIHSTVLEFLTEKEIQQLKEACELHTTTLRTEDATVSPVAKVMRTGTRALLMEQVASCLVQMPRNSLTSMNTERP